jgi:hypothetical protein
MNTSTDSRGREFEVDPTAWTVAGGAGRSGGGEAEPRAARPGSDEPREAEPREDEPNGDEPGAAALAAAGELARMSAQDALTAGVYLLVVLVGVMSQLAGGGTAVVRLALLVPVAACFAVSAGLVVRSRIMLVRALGELRRRTGAPLYPFTPWTPYASGAPLTSAAFEHELRQVVSAAGRCCALAGQATAWAAATGLLFVFWTLIGIPGR